MTNVPCMSEEKLRNSIFQLLSILSLDVLVIIECRAADQDQSLILCCTNKESDNLLVFQFKLAGQIYGMEKKVTYRASPSQDHSLCFKQRPQI